MASDFRCLLRHIPAMEKVLNDERSLVYLKTLDRDGLKDICRSILDRIRADVLSGRLTSFCEDDFYSLLALEMKPFSEISLRPLVNGTGVVVHTNLGRSCLAKEALEAVASVAGNYSTLEYDLKEGGRGHRNSHVESLLCRITGAEGAVAVNNNAGAVLLCLAALASGKSSVVSRGELVEIGGSFRVPDIMAFSGTELVEVGTTNRTHLKDYADAIDGRTAMIMKVHPSNFRIVGFRKEVPREELASLAKEKSVIFMEDLGSGILPDLAPIGLSGEPTVRQCLDAGADLVTFSGDKLLGGPQIGGIVGKKTLIDRIRTYPLLRALRCDKMTLAAMEATLRLYLKGEWKKIPTLAMLSMSKDDLTRIGNRLLNKLKPLLPHGSSLYLTDADDAVGGGAFPALPVPGCALSLTVPGMSAGALQERLREAPCPVVAGAREGELLIHCRTLLEGDADRIAQAFAWVLGG